MKSKQVLSVEQMMHLKELGLDTSDGSMCFEWNESDSDNMVVASPDADTKYLPFTKAVPTSNKPSTSTIVPVAFILAFILISFNIPVFNTPAQHLVG